MTLTFSRYVRKNNTTQSVKPHKDRLFTGIVGINIKTNHGMTVLWKLSDLVHVLSSKS